MPGEEEEDGDYVSVDEAEKELKVKDEDDKGDRFGDARQRNDTVMYMDLFKDHRSLKNPAYDS